MKHRIIIGLAVLLVASLLLYAGGAPSKGTPADKRLARNKPGATKQTKVTKAAMPVKATKARKIP